MNPKHAKRITLAFVILHNICTDVHDKTLKIGISTMTHT